MREFELEAFSAEEDILNKGLGRNNPNISVPSLGGGNSNWGIPISLGGTSLDPSTDHSIWNASTWSDAFGFGGSGDSGDGGGVEESGGLSEEDLAMKRKLYGKLEGLIDRPYNPYTGDMYTDRSPEELALLKEMQEGADFDTARTNLGFTSDVYKDAVGYDVDRLSADASRLMDEGSVYRDKVADTTMRQMNEAATMSGMINRGHQVGGGTAFGDRAYMQDMWGKENYLSAAGDQLGKMNLGAYQDSLNRARTLQQDRLGAAGLYGNTVMTDLGIGRQGQASRFGAFQQDRGYQDRDKAYDRQMHYERENDPYKKLAFNTGIFSSMPFDEKVVTQQPASGGK